MIQPDLLKCSICYIEYDEIQCIPKILPTCGHTICSQCLDQILTIKPPKCPLDRKVIENKQSSKDFLTNLALVQLLDERGSVKFGMCSTHQAQKDLFCLTDKAKICQSCADEKDDPKHQGHEIKPLSEINNLAQAKSDQLKIVMRKADTEQQKVYELLEEKKKEALGLKKRKFDQLRTFIDRKEEEAWSEIELMFTQKKTKTEERYKKDLELKQQLQIQLNVLNSNKMDENFFKMLNQEVKQKCSIEDEKQEIDSFTKKIVNEFKSTDESLHKSVISAFNKFQPRIELDENSKSNVDSQQQDPNNGFQFSQIRGLLDLSKHNNALKVFYPEMDKCAEGVAQEDSAPIVDFISVKSVELDFRRRKITEEIVSAICYLWRNLYDINSLSINLHNRKLNNNDEYSLFFSHCFWATDKIQTFKFNVIQDDDEPSKSNLNSNIITSRIMPSMISMVNLKELHFSLSSTEASDASVIKLAEDVLCKLTKLEKFTLDLVYTNITDNSIEHLCTIMSEYLLDIQAFDLNLKGTQATKKTLKKLSELIFPELVDLTSFKLNLDQLYIEDRDFEKFFLETRQYMKNMKTYVLHLDSCGITDKGVNIFAKHLLPLMTTLEHFGFYLGDNDTITDLSVEKFFKKFSAKNIKSFAFQLCSGQITDQSICTFAETLLPNMPLLENLTLTLDTCKIGDEGMKEFWRKLEPIAKNLKSFKSEFTFCDNISDDSFNVFLDKIFPHMGALTELELQINDNISESSLDLFLVILKEKAPQLESIRLGFCENVDINEQNVDMLAKDILPLMKNLKKFWLNLHETDFSTENLENLCVGMKGLKNLENFKVIYVHFGMGEDELERLRNLNPHLRVEQFYITNV